MKFFITLFVVAFTFLGNTQSLNLTKVVVVGQQDKTEDKYSLELAVMQTFEKNGIKSKSSLGILKQGEHEILLADKRYQEQLSSEGFDTYFLISVRGYDKKFLPASKIVPLREELDAGHMFSFYRESASNVSFSVTFYRDGQAVFTDLIRVRSGNNRESVLKKLSKALDKKIKKKWN